MANHSQPPFFAGAPTHGGRLLLFSLPVQGHMTPMFQLADVLHSKGFSITIIHTKFNSPDPSNHPHFTFLPISEDLSQSESEAASRSAFDLTYILNAKCKDPFRHCLARLFSPNENRRPSALISDPALHFAREVSNAFGLPRFVLRTSGCSAFRASCSFPLLLEKGILPIQEHKLEEAVTDLPPLRVKDLPANNVPDINVFAKFLAELVEEARTSSGVIFNSFSELEHSSIYELEQTFPAPLFPIGPFHRRSPTMSTSLNPDRTSISWLDKQETKSVVYVSFGSVVSVDEAKCLEIAYGLANSNCHFLWVIRPGSVNGLDWKKALPEGYLNTLDGRGYIVEWAPQTEVLAHPSIGAFWTHCGWNSTLESICEGVPMICTPCFGDQVVNSRYISHDWKIGVELRDELERNGIEKAVRNVILEEDGREIRERALELKEKARLTLVENGASYHSLESLIGLLVSEPRR